MELLAHTPLDLTAIQSYIIIYFYVVEAAHHETDDHISIIGGRQIDSKLIEGCCASNLHQNDILSSTHPNDRISAARNYLSEEFLKQLTTNVCGWNSFISRIISNYRFWHTKSIIGSAATLSQMWTPYSGALNQRAQALNRTLHV